MTISVSDYNTQSECVSIDLLCLAEDKAVAAKISTGDQVYLSATETTLDSALCCRSCALDTVNVAEDPGADGTTHHVDHINMIPQALTESVEPYLVSSNSLAACIKSHDVIALSEVCAKSSHSSTGDVDPIKAIKCSVEYVIRNSCNCCHPQITQRSTNKPLCYTGELTAIAIMVMLPSKEQAEKSTVTHLVKIGYLAYTNLAADLIATGGTCTQAGDEAIDNMAAVQSQYSQCMAKVIVRWPVVWRISSK